MKRFIVLFAIVLMFVVGITLIAGAMQDVTGFKAYLVATLPHHSWSFLVFLSLVGIGYSVFSFMRYATLTTQYVKHIERSYLVGIADVIFGLAGLVIVYASWATIPGPDTTDLLPTHLSWLVAVLALVMGFGGMMMPTLSALVFVVAVPMTGAYTALSEWELEARYRSKRTGAGHKMFMGLRRLRDMT